MPLSAVHLDATIVRRHPGSGMAWFANCVAVAISTPHQGLKALGLGSQHADVRLELPM